MATRFIPFDKDYGNKLSNKELIDGIRKVDKALHNLVDNNFADLPQLSGFFLFGCSDEKKNHEYCGMCPIVELCNTISSLAITFNKTYIFMYGFEGIEDIYTEILSIYREMLMRKINKNDDLFSRDTTDYQRELYERSIYKGNIKEMIRIDTIRQKRARNKHKKKSKKKG